MKIAKGLLGGIGIGILAVVCLLLLNWITCNTCAKSCEASRSGSNLGIIVQSLPTPHWDTFIRNAFIFCVTIGGVVGGIYGIATQIALDKRKLKELKRKEEARSLIERTSKGNPELKHQLGLKYLVGEYPLEKDVDAAIICFQTALEEGYNPAQKQLEMILERNEERLELDSSIVGKWELQTTEGGCGIFWEFTDYGTYKSINSGRIVSEGRYKICGNLLILDKDTPDELETSFKLDGDILSLDGLKSLLKKVSQLNNEVFGICPHFDIEKNKCGLLDQAEWDRLIMLGMAVHMAQTLCSTSEWPNCGSYKLAREEDRL